MAQVDDMKAALVKSAADATKLDADVDAYIAKGPAGCPATAADLAGFQDSINALNARLEATDAKLAAAVSGLPAVPQAISSVVPASGPVDSTVTILGSGFEDSQATSSVTFNGTLAQVSAWSDTSITAKVPGGATSGKVVVMIGNRGSNGFQYNVTSA